MSKVLLKALAVLGVFVIGVIALFAMGVIEPPAFLDIYGDKTQTEQPNSSDSDNSTENNVIDVNQVPSALNIELSGDYLYAFENTAKHLSKDDVNTQILIKVGLQILQSKSIKYKNALHFYSLDYTNSCDEANKERYNLLDAINKINSNKLIYTDCFGFVRLTHSITCYTINNSDPESVPGLGGLYGYKGAYSQGKFFYAMSQPRNGAVVYDCLTGPGTGERHVAMYLYSEENGTIHLMDESGLRVGTFNENGYIFSVRGSGVYKFNKYKNYNYV